MSYENYIERFDSLKGKGLEAWLNDIIIDANSNIKKYSDLIKKVVDYEALLMKKFNLTNSEVHSLSYKFENNQETGKRETYIKLRKDETIDNDKRKAKLREFINIQNLNTTGIESPFYDKLFLFQPELKYYTELLEWLKKEIKYRNIKLSKKTKNILELNETVEVENKDLLTDGKIKFKTSDSIMELHSNRGWQKFLRAVFIVIVENHTLLLKDLKPYEFINKYFRCFGHADLTTSYLSEVIKQINHYKYKDVNYYKIVNKTIISFLQDMKVLPKRAIVKFLNIEEIEEYYCNEEKIKQKKDLYKSYL